MSRDPSYHLPRNHRSIGVLVRSILLLAICLAVAPAPAADRSAPVEEDARWRFTQVERVQLVLLQASVSDSRGRPVLGLGRDDFTLFDGDDEAEIEFFATETETPIALAFLLDVSGSMRQPGKLDASKEAILEFVEALGPRDRFGLIAFADDQVAWITHFTSNAAVFRKRLDVQEGYGQTAIYDALAASPGLVDEEIQSRKAIVLFTDGLDNASRLTSLEAVQTARRVSVPIYAVHFIPRSRTMLSEEDRAGLLTLERFSRETGGALFAVQHAEDLREAIERIQEELRSQYVIGFSPAETESPRSFRRIRLETRQSRLHVRTRTGYYPGS